MKQTMKLKPVRRDERSDLCSRWLMTMEYTAQKD